MDHFLEEIVIRRKRAISELLYYLSNVVMVFSAIIGLWMLSNLISGFSLAALVITVVFCGAAVLLYLYRDRLRTEYEYTFTNGELDFAQVFNNQKRKNLGTMRVKNVEVFGPVDSNAFRKLINMPGITRRNWFLNREASLYYLYYHKENARTVIVFEPTDDMVATIKKYLPHGVFQV
ncbi:MAG: hypothetical protein VB041_10435 [Candidatus Limiplasma sp.]|nr:hypothetical protein [Candidatus Limiplasma sp.]